MTHVSTPPQAEDLLPHERYVPASHWRNAYDEADAAKLAAALEELLAAGPRLAAMGRAARDLAHPGAAAVIADRVEALAKGVAA